MEQWRFQVRVTPGARVPAVGPAWAGDPRVLVVAVRERAVGGAANEAVRRALAGALEVAPRDLDLIAGSTARLKRWAVRVEDEAQQERVRQRWAWLLADGSEEAGRSGR